MFWTMNGKRKPLIAALLVPRVCERLGLGPFLICLPLDFLPWLGCKGARAPGPGVPNRPGSAMRADKIQRQREESGGDTRKEFISARPALGVSQRLSPKYRRHFQVHIRQVCIHAGDCEGQVDCRLGVSHAASRWLRAALIA